jgi:hypothetical protein
MCSTCTCSTLANLCVTGLGMMHLTLAYEMRDF